MEEGKGNSILVEDLTVRDGTLSVKFKDGKLLSFEDCWLRDNCRCNQCYNTDTHQKALHVLDIPESKILSAHFSNDEVTIIWDDKHRTSFDPNFLREMDYQEWSARSRLKPVIWHGDAADKVQRIHKDKFLYSEEGAKMVFQSLLDYGVALIDGVEATLSATEVICKALGGVQRTLFGDMWQFTTRADHADTAYTNLPLATHHDNTYFTEAAGLQILHCIEHIRGSGGDTILTDGFYGAECLRKEHPEDFDFLTKHDVEAQYIENGHHHKYSAPIIQLDSRTGDLKQMRFNVYDRSPMPFANKKDCRAFYRSIRNLSKYYQDESHQWIFKLTPGLLMVIDNFRVLHGRTAFTGSRVLCGCYVARSDWLDKARALKLIY